MSDTMRNYNREMAEEVATLCDRAYAQYRSLFPLQLLSRTKPRERFEALEGFLAGSEVFSDASFVAVRSGQIVSAAIARRFESGLRWWRIATAPEHRGRGLASRCMAAGEEAARRVADGAVAQVEMLDSRWEGAKEMLTGRGYSLRDPGQRNITMLARDWSRRALDLSEEYALDTLVEDDLSEWMEVRNEIFPGEREASWFRERFMSRSDWDLSGWYVARHGGRIVGMAGVVCVEEDRDAHRPRGAQIEWVGVLQEHRGKHLGEKLVVACMNHAAERDFLPVILLTQPFRVPAVRLYEKLGFRTIAAWQQWEKSLT